MNSHLKLHKKMTKYKVEHLINDTYQVLRVYDDPTVWEVDEPVGGFDYENADRVFQGSMADCLAFIRIDQGKGYEDYIT